MSLRVLVLYNLDWDGPESASGSERAGGDAGETARAEVADVARAVSDALVKLGAAVHLRGVQSVGAVVRAVRQFAADVVFNLCESLDGDPRYESSVAAILERLGVPMTGSRTECLRLCLDKHACGEVLRRAGVPVPRSVIATDSPPHESRGLGWPMILKPNGEDGSTGIWSGSVVDDQAGYADALARLRAAGLTPAIAQRYIAGREINVALLGEQPRRLLPINEIDFTAMPAELPRIVSYESKWIDGSSEWRGTQVIPAELAPATARALARHARAAADAVGMGAYGRVDFRIDAAGQPWVVDVNPNCGLAPDAGFANAAARAKLGYPELIAQIVGAAIERAEPGRAPSRSRPSRPVRV